MRRCVQLLALLTLALPASAQWNVAAYLGGARSHDSLITLEQPALDTDLLLRDVSWDSQSFTGPVYYGARGGYFFSRSFGVEAEFIHLKVFAETEREVKVDGRVGGATVSGRRAMSDFVQRFSISHGVNLLVGNVVWRRNFFAESGDELGRLLWNSRFGFGATIPHPENQVLGEFHQGYEWGRPALHTAQGVEFRVWRNVYLLGEYKFTATWQKVKVSQGTAETLLATHHGVFGLSLHF